MTTIINAKNITLGEVSQFLKFQEQLNNDTYTIFLSLESLTEIEQLGLKSRLLSWAGKRPTPQET